MSNAGGSHGGGGLPGLSLIETFLHDSQGNASIHITAKQLISLFAVVIVTFFIFEPQQTLNNFGLVIFLSPLWVSIVVGRFAFYRYVQTKRVEQQVKQSYVLLEVKMPRDTTKTPLAMETFFSNIHIGSGEATWYKRLVQGAMRPWWSFEIASLGGRLHFYIWTRAGYRRVVESYFYAQHPDVEIIEAEDYSRLTDPSDHDHMMFGAEYGKSKPDPLPIKTYIDYGLTPGAKPEENVDPLGALLEIMGSIGPGEQMWLQFIIRTDKNEKYKGMKTAEGKPYTWRDVAMDEIEKERTKMVRKTKKVDPVTGAVSETESFPNPTKGQGDKVAAIEQNISKQAFDTGIRCIYLGTEAAFQGIMIPVQINLFKSFNNESNNSISIKSIWNAAFNDFPWEDRSGHHRHHVNHEITRLYRQRAYYADPYRGPWSILSTQELATLFHVPTSGVTAPGLERIQSSTTSAPANLPT